MSSTHYGRNKMPKGITRDEYAKAFVDDAKARGKSSMV